MEKTIEMYDGDAIVKYTETDEKKQILWDRVILFCKENNASSGESIQEDKFNLEAPTLIADIIDEVLGFNTEWK